MIVSFALQKFFGFMKSHLLIVRQLDPIKKSFPTPISWRQLPMFSFNNFSVLGSMCKPFTPLELVSVQYDTY